MVAGSEDNGPACRLPSKVRMSKLSQWHAGNADE
jgi:hypothetical protein